MELDYPWIRKTLLTVAHPVLPLVGQIRLPLEPLLAVDDWADFKSTRPLSGTLILCRRRGHLSNRFIPGAWKHLAGYVRKGGEDWIVEAVYPKVRKTLLRKWMLEQDYLNAIVPNGWATPAEMELAGGFLWSLIGEPYDLSFTFAAARQVNKAFYCSESGYWSFLKVFEAAGKTMPFTLRQTMGVDTIAPDDYVLANGIWKSVWSRPMPAS